MTVTNPTPTTTYTFNVESADGSSLGTMQGQPALPEPGDVLELLNGQEVVYWKVRTRRFTHEGRVTLIVERVR
jgi:hypothetical protein